MTTGVKSGVVGHGAASVRPSSAGCVVASVVSVSNSAMGMEEVVAQQTTSEEDVSHAGGRREETVRTEYYPDVVVQGR